MWEMRNRTPFAAERALDRDKNGHEFWCVMVKATFDLVHDAPLPVSEDQRPVSLEPVYDADAVELLTDTDVVPFMPSTELLLDGTMRAPSPAKSYHDVGVMLGSLRKHARIFGPRRAQPSWIGWDVMSEGPVIDTPLTWGNTFGGIPDDPDLKPHKTNPAGCGIEMQHKSVLNPDAPISLPLISDPEQDYLTDYSVARPCGFGPTQRHWPERLKYAGTYDQHWQDNRMPLLPHDFDPRFYHAAPPDQIAPKHFVGGEQGRLLGFTRDPLHFRLPQVVLTVRTRLDKEYIDHRFTMVRVQIDVGAPRVSILWVASLPCDGRDHLVEFSEVRVRQMAGVAI